MARTKKVQIGPFTGFIDEVEIIRPIQAKPKIVQQHYRKVIKPNYK